MVVSFDVAQQECLPFERPLESQPECPANRAVTAIRARDPVGSDLLAGIEMCSHARGVLLEADQLPLTLDRNAKRGQPGGEDPLVLVWGRVTENGYGLSTVSRANLPRLTRSAYICRPVVR
jgi:hypothetical protein